MHFSFPDAYWNKGWVDPKAVPLFAELDAAYKLPRTKDGRPVTFAVVSDREFQDWSELFEVSATHPEFFLQPIQSFCNLFGVSATYSEFLHATYSEFLQPIRSF